MKVGGQVKLSKVIRCQICNDEIGHSEHLARRGKRTPKILAWIKLQAADFILLGIICWCRSSRPPHSSGADLPNQSDRLADEEANTRCLSTPQ
jgi:hypothetical protein